MREENNNEHVCQLQLENVHYPVTFHHKQEALGSIPSGYPFSLPAGLRK